MFETVLYKDTLRFCCVSQSGYLCAFEAICPFLSEIRTAAKCNAFCLAPMVVAKPRELVRVSISSAVA
jgi:hypothetical protein